MGLFDTIVNAISDPETEGSNNQISSIVNTVQQLSNDCDAEPSAVQSAMSIVGNYTRSALQEKRENEGESAVQGLISQFAGTQASNQVIQALFSNSQKNQMTEEIENQTGLSQDIVKSMLPSLVPLILKFLKIGSNSNNPLMNSVLNGFLDADGDGDVDIADLMILASKHLK